jgi:hypothetical protein
MSEHVSRPSPTSTWTVLVGILLVVPLLYMASIPVCAKILCRPEPGSGLQVWYLNEKPPSWFNHYTKPLAWALQNPTFHEFIGKPYGAYRDWVYRLGN